MSKGWLLRQDTRPKLRESGLAPFFCLPRTLVGVRPNSPAPTPPDSRDDGP
jgi:hypothetical protein